MSERRLLFKVLLWRIISVTITLFVTWIVSGDLSEATGLTIVLHLVLIVGHFLFEKVWLYLVDNDDDKIESTS